MSYVLSDALQTAVYETLTADATLMSLVDGAIYDALPTGQVPELYVNFGAERVRDRSDASVRAALHEFAVTVISDTPGYLSAKKAAGRIAEILDDSKPDLSRGRVVRMDFFKATARVRGKRREVEIWFRAFVEDVTLD
ncbi:MAG: DUF3168 domain-containing protein [Pseudomonadota bacterium]